MLLGVFPEQVLSSSHEVRLSLFHSLLLVPIQIPIEHLLQSLGDLHFLSFHGLIVVVRVYQLVYVALQFPL